MKLSLARIFPSLEQKKYRAYVLYGSNNSLIQSLIQEISTYFSHESVSLDQFESYRFDLETPLLFGRKPEVIYGEGKINWPVIGPILSAWPIEHPVVVSCASISLPWSKSREIAFVACYEATFEESKSIISRYMLREKIHLDAAALDWCAEWSQSGQWHSVMSVLSLVASTDHALDLEALRLLCPERWDDIHLAILHDTWKNNLRSNHANVMMGKNGCENEKKSGQGKEKKSNFGWDLEFQDDPVSILRSWQRLMLQVWQLKQFLEHQPAEQALESVRPTIFFKHKNLILQTAETWSKMRILRCLEQLIQTESALKKNLMEAKIFLFQLLQNS